MSSSGLIDLGTSNVPDLNSMFGSVDLTSLVPTASGTASVDTSGSGGSSFDWNGLVNTIGNLAQTGLKTYAGVQAIDLASKRASQIPAGYTLNAAGQLTPLNLASAYPAYSPYPNYAAPSQNTGTWLFLAAAAFVAYQFGKKGGK